VPWLGSACFNKNGQAECARGSRELRIWNETGVAHPGNEKMSESVNNCTVIVVSVLQR
jgi:cysteinyl-tRNA synthetase